MHWQSTMDLGIAGRTGLVCASSRGLGRACADALAAAGVNLVINARDEAALKATAAAIKAKHGVTVTPVAADVTTTAGRNALLCVCPMPDILVTNAGGPPSGDFRDWDEAVWIGAVQANMVSPIMLIRATIDGMIARGFGRIINITSGAVKAPIATLGLSNGARAGLTGFVAGLAREVARHGVTINNLLPGPFETDRLKATIGAMAQRQGLSFEQAWEVRRNSNPSCRYGRPEELGAFCAFLASSHAGYFTGQNVLLDGGAFPGVF